MTTVKPDSLPEALQNGKYKTVYNQTSNNFQKEVSYREFAKLVKNFFTDTDYFKQQSEVFKFLRDAGITSLSVFLCLILKTRKWSIENF